MWFPDLQHEFRAKRKSMDILMENVFSSMLWSHQKGSVKALDSDIVVRAHFHHVQQLRVPQAVSGCFALRASLHTRSGSQLPGQVSGCSD